jgi:hypothetical protein
VADALLQELDEALRRNSHAKASTLAQRYGDSGHPPRRISAGSASLGASSKSLRPGGNPDKYLCQPFLNRSGWVRLGGRGCRHRPRNCRRNRCQCCGSVRRNGLPVFGKSPRPPHNLEPVRFRASHAFLDTKPTRPPAAGNRQHLSSKLDQFTQRLHQSRCRVDYRTEEILSFVQTLTAKYQGEELAEDRVCPTTISDGPRVWF